MKNEDPKLLLFHAPLLRQDMTTPTAMRDVIIALLPAIPLSILVSDLLEKSFNVGLSETMEEALDSMK